MTGPDTAAAAGATVSRLGLSPSQATRPTS